MKVFVTGATGYVGFSVASAFRRAGHRVYGLLRSKDKASMLARSEIIPVFGDMNNPESYLSAAEDCSVLVHAAADMKGDFIGLDRKTVEALIAAGKKGSCPKTVIYTSGVWVHGNTGGKLVDETDPPTPAKLVAWRPAHEDVVLKTKDVKGLVIRPGCVYGRQGSLTSLWFAGAREKALRVIGEGNNRWAMVHADDLSDAYLRAAESGLSGEAFNVTDFSRSTVREMVSAAARASGYDGEIQYIPVAEASKTMGDFAECLALDQRVDNRKAIRLLGWMPKHIGFVDEIETYFESYKAAQT